MKEILLKDVEEGKRYLAYISFDNFPDWDIVYFTKNTLQGTLVTLSNKNIIYSKFCGRIFELPKLD